MIPADRTIEVLNVPDPNIGALGAHGMGEMRANGVPPGSAPPSSARRIIDSAFFPRPNKLIEAHHHG